MVARLRTPSLPEQVATYVRELIFSGLARPGEFLRLEPIAGAMGVSNTPVREGLLALASEGFVSLVPRRGFIVEGFTPDDVYDLFWTQAELAGELAARAAKRITRQELRDLEAVLADHEEAFKTGDEERIGRTGERFHRRVNRAADSPRLARILTDVAHHLPPRFYASLEGHVQSTHQDHRSLLEALRTADAVRARAVAEGHILESTDHLIALMRRRGLWEVDAGEASTRDVSEQRRD